MSGSFVASSELSTMSHIRKAGLTSLGLKMRSLDLMLIPPYAQMFLSMMKAALALLILTLPVAWHHRVSVRTGWPGVSIL